MIYVTQLLLNPRCKQVQSELRNPYEMHRTLSRAFPDSHEPYGEARCLFRVDEGKGASDLRLIVQVRVMPDWEYLANTLDYLCGPPETKSVQPQLTVGQTLAFRLRANPTVKTDGKIRALDTEEAQIDWLVRKSEANGFALTAARTKGGDVIRFRTTRQFDTVLYVVTLEGMLRVTDAARLGEALDSGIGRAKAFGCGMLSLARRT